jgi:serine phosphatase RsbU (regulator of sigma subunit)
VIGDVSGKGLAAASQVSAVVNMLRFALQTGKSIADAIDQVNRVLMSQELIQGFLTLFVGIYDDSISEMRYVICGQEAPIVYRSKNSAVQGLKGDGPPLGIDDNAVYVEHQLALKSGDLFLAFTDGLTESGPNRLDLLGHEGVCKLFAEASSKTDIESVLTDVVIRARGRAMGFFDDDACVLAIAVN